MMKLRILLVLAMVLSLVALTTVGAAAAEAKKVTICHQTGSSSNPVVVITVSANALAAHLAHGDSIAFIIDIDKEGNATYFCGKQLPK